MSTSTFSSRSQRVRAMLTCGPPELTLEWERVGMRVWQIQAQLDDFCEGESLHGC